MCGLMVAGAKLSLLDVGVQIELYTSISMHLGCRRLTTVSPEREVFGLSII